MNDALEPPDKDDGDAGDRPPTVFEQMLVREARGVVAQSATWTARKFPRLVHDSGMMTVADLGSIGELALYRAARTFREDYNRDFASYARHRVRFAMLDAIDDLLFEERVKRAGFKAEANYCGYSTDDDYNVMKHDEVEARRRYRAFANGELVAAFVAMIEEAQTRLDMAELAERGEYERAVVSLRMALARLSKPDQKLLSLMYCDLLHLKKASEVVGVPYGTARARHSRALTLLHDALVEQGIARTPRPLVAPDVGDVLDARAPPGVVGGSPHRRPPHNDIEPAPRGSKKPTGSK